MVALHYLKYTHPEVESVMHKSLSIPSKRDCIVFEEGRIDIWVAHLGNSDNSYQSLYRFLSPVEKERADRFIYESDHQAFVICRGKLRELLARYVNCSSSDISLINDSLGKPVVLNQYGERTIRFNLSHSRDFAIFAITLDHEIGIDIEYIQHIPNVNQISEIIFSVKELAEFQSISPEQRLKAFYTAWTRKEAFVKATGIGLNMPLNLVNVGFDKGESIIDPIELSSKDFISHPSEWRVRTLDINGKYSVSVAFENTSSQIVVRGDC